MERATTETGTRHPTRTATWRHCAFMLALVVVVHQFVMLTPIHTHGLPTMAAEAPLARMAQPCDCDADPMPMVAQVCAATEAALRAHAGSGLLLALVVAFAALRRPVARAAKRGLVPWLWPPNRRRALLQVFLC